MNDAHTPFEPVLRFLSDENREALYEAALQVLEAIGMRVFHEEGLASLKKAGCRVDEEGIVRIPRTRVEQAVKTAPNRIPVFDREGGPAMDLGGRRAYFGTGSDLIYALDGATGGRHQCTLEDVARAARVADAMPNIDFVMSFAHPHEQDPRIAYLESFRAMVENTVKPIVNTAEGRRDLAEMWEIAKILRGGEDRLRERPYWIHYAEPISPLKHPHASVDKLLFCADTGMPVIYSPAPIAGSTAPMTLAGHIVQGLAESLFGLVMHQLRAEGAPFLMGMGAAVLDMVTGQCSYNAPEYLMAYMGIVEMSHHLDIPNWGYAGTSDAQVPDGQACFEGGLLSFLSTAAGSNLNHDVGYLDFGRTGSLEMIVIMDEFIDQIRRMQRGIDVGDGHIALDVIREAGRSGDYLMHPHTLEHMRGTQWRPKLLNRRGYEKWEAAGKTDLLDRARIRLAEVLEGHRPRPLAPETLEAVQGRTVAFSEKTAREG